MKIHAIGLICSAALISSGMIYAQEQGGMQANQAARFTEHKAEMLKRVNEEKAMLDQTTNCINSAQNRDDFKKCHEAKRANMKKIHESARAHRKEQLQNEIKKLDAQTQEPQKQD